MTSNAPKHLKRSLIMGVLLVAGLGTGTQVLAATTSNAPAIYISAERPVADGWYSIFSNLSSSLAINVTTNNDNGNVNYIDMRDFTGASSQSFYFEYDATKNAYQIKAANPYPVKGMPGVYTNQVLSFVTQNGVVELAPNINADSQYWIISGDSTTGISIRNYAQQNDFLDVDRGIAQAGIGILTYQQNNAINQMFTLKPNATSPTTLASGNYNITTATIEGDIVFRNSLTVAPDNTVSLQRSNTFDFQAFSIAYDANKKAYTIAPNGTGYAGKVLALNPQTGRVEVVTATGADDEYWTITPNAVTDSAIQNLASPSTSLVNGTNAFSINLAAQ